MQRDQPEYGQRSLILVSLGIILVGLMSACDLLTGAEPYRLTVERSGAGKVTSAPDGIDCGRDCTGTYPAGTSVTLTAIDQAGASFIGWAGACSNGDSGNQCVVTMSRDMTIHAYFTATPPGSATLTVGKAGDGSGIVTSTPDGIDCGNECSEHFPEGTKVELVATAADGSALDSWDGCDSSQGDECTVLMGGNTAVTATFAQVTRDLMVEVVGEGSVTSEPVGVDIGGPGSESAPFEAGAAVELTASAAEGWAFDRWSGDCDSTSADVCTLNMDSDKAVSATFTDSPGVHGVTVSPNSATLEVDQSVQLTAEVDATSGVDTTVDWATSQSGVATVDAKGLVEAVGEGEATISATSAYDPTVSGTASITVVSNFEGVRITPASSTCDGAAVGDECQIGIRVVESDAPYMGFEFETAAAGFTVVEAQAGNDLPAGECFVAAGPSKVVGVCEQEIGGDGEIVRLTVERRAPEPTTATVYDAFLAMDSTTKTPVGGGTLGIAGSD